MEEQDIEMKVGDITLRGILGIPDRPSGIILFAHGSGSSRLSPRNAYVARMLQQSGFATLLVDLLTIEEERNRENVFNIALLATRLQEATQWVMRNPDTKDLRIGYFGASTGSAAALQAAAELRDVISALVSRGGRPDMAMEYLPYVNAPTLLIVGGLDESIIPLNQTALEKIETEKQLVVIPGATHLFEEPGALEKVAQVATDWFIKHLLSERSYGA